MNEEIVTLCILCTLSGLLNYIEKNKEFCQYLVPEVKARMLYILTEGTALFSPDDDIEDSIISLLSTVHSEREYQEILEHMGEKINKGDSEAVKAQRVASHENKIIDIIKITNNKRTAIKELYWVLDENQEMQYMKWRGNLRKSLHH